MTVREVLSQNLAIYRKRAHYTLKEAAEVLGTKLSTVSSWERGVSQPSADMLVSIAKHYKVPLSDLCGTDYKVEYSTEEKDLMFAYRNADETDKQVVKRILGIREKKDSPVQKEA